MAAATKIINIVVCTIGSESYANILYSSHNIIMDHFIGQTYIVSGYSKEDKSKKICVLELV